MKLMPSTRRSRHGQGWILLLTIAILTVVGIGVRSGAPVPEPVVARLPATYVTHAEGRSLLGPTMDQLARQGPGYSDVWRRFYPRPSLKPGPPGEALVERSNRWWKVDVLNADGVRYLVRFQDQETGTAEWVGEDEILFQVEPGDWLPVLQTNAAALSAVLTGGWRTTADPELIHRTLPFGVANSNGMPTIHGSPKRGDLLVHRDGAWWPARVIQSEGNRHLVRYASRVSETDEWVTEERISVYAGDDAVPGQ